MSSKPQKILIIPDVHAPYHDKTAWKLLLKAAKKWKPHTIICMGDFFDFYSVSSHDKDPRRQRSLQKEVEESIKVHQDLDRLGAKRKIFIEGNHEDRLRRYLQTKAPELYELVQIPQVLELESRGWEYVPYKDHIKIGKVFFTHDCGHAGITALTKSQSIYEDNLVIGHTHRMEYRVLGNAKGAPHIAASFGWLGDPKKVDYMHRIKVLRNWASGFGLGYLNPKTGAMRLQPVPIFQRQLLLEGEVVSLDSK